MEIDKAGKGWLTEMAKSANVEFLAVPAFASVFPDIPIPHKQTAGELPAPGRNSFIKSLFRQASKPAVRVVPRSVPTSAEDGDAPFVKQTETELDYKARPVSV